MVLYNRGLYFTTNTINNVIQKRIASYCNFFRWITTAKATELLETTTTLQRHGAHEKQQPSSYQSNYIQSSTHHKLCSRIAQVVCTPIRPLSINEILSLHTGANANENKGVKTDGFDEPAKPDIQRHNSENAKPVFSAVTNSNYLLSDNRDWAVLLLRSANWARKEIPLRLAHRLSDFSRLPFVVVSNEHIYEVYQLYCRAFEILMDFGNISTLEDEKRFTQQLRETVTAHGNVVALMQRGISTLKQIHTGIELDTFLNNLFGTRIGNRVLAETHLALHDNPEWFDHGTKIGPTQSTLGVIQRHCRPYEVLESVATKVQQVAMYTYGCTPEVKLDGELDLSFPYIPEHLRFIGSEILKNSIRATIEYHVRQKKTNGLPSVNIGVHKGEAHVVIKVTDQGGGLNESLHDAIWHYGFSTVSSISTDNHLKKRHMAGYGFGLPLSRLYARYFGGDVDIKFMDGYGTDTYIFLPRLGNQKESEEMLNNSLYGGNKLHRK